VVSENPLETLIEVLLSMVSDKRVKSVPGLLAQLSKEHEQISSAKRVVEARKSFPECIDLPSSWQ